jgi:type IX secretion system PorP/SprF family membrane protein
MKLKFILAVTLCLIISISNAQNPVFTQFYLVPETLNPAFTGISNTWNAGIIHRRQWPDGNRRIDTQFGFANNLISDEIGVGISVLNHSEVFTGYNYFNFNGAFAYRIDLDYTWRLRLGLEAGYGRKDFNFSNLLLEDQININTGAINPVSIDPGVLNTTNNINFVDFSAGFVFDQENAWFGAAVKHLNRPDISFRENANVPLDLFLTVHGGFYYEFLNSPTSLIPEGTNLLITGNYMRQGEYNRLDIGTVMDYSRFSFGLIFAINPEGKTSNSHMLTSLNPVLSFKSSEFTFGYSYDYNTSRIGNTQGVHEFSLTWQSTYRCDRCDNYKVKLKRNGESGYQKM